MATYDRRSEIKAFDDTKAGVKGLVDAGVTRIPRFFHHPPDAKDGPDPTSVPRPEIPVIDLGDTAGRESVVELVRRASETFGFFQVLNHGVPQAVMDGMLEGVRRFNEQDLKVKMRYYTRDRSKTVIFNSNFDLYESPVANWRDTLYCGMAPEPAAKPEDLPEACRDIIMEYTSHIQRLGRLLFELLSEGLGLDSQYLNDLECGKGLSHLSHYYPPCPEPELAIGTSKHADSAFLNVLLQDTIGGLQVLHQNQWIDVPPIPGAFIINIGDLLQLISNDKFKSVEHRVLASKNGPRVSVACFFFTRLHPLERRYGPIQKLLSEKNPPKYKDVTVREFVTFYYSKGLDGKSALENFRL
ncbi:hypothetical protein KFK09_020251 [Dendrobium nobile]|uniref:Fe2OG dioxygenase domain-containing protein n=1 Tax=Dendrobium nobile TaxID=94219 RepID=A0A8T3ATC6_DENNO|nr:hypothetical protein KFK09_020251 [Dendrobium nobile]